MTQEQTLPELRMIPVDQIDVLNPRGRNHRAFADIVANIQAIGLKKPITVTRRKVVGSAERYLLVCGEGRLKAFKALEEPLIPALVVEVSDDDAFIMSLTENMARRRYRPLELLSGIKQLLDRRYDRKTIAQKTGLSFDWVADIVTLLESGEERLLVAVEQGRIPLSAAAVIASAGEDGTAVQHALQEAYESGQLHVRQLSEARRIIERRQALGRTITKGQSDIKHDVTSSSLVKAYKSEVDRQRMTIKKATFVQQQLLFVVGAFKQLLADEGFINLLQAENLDTLPKYLAERVGGAAK